jgi:phosphoenolpyruvate carboxylase
MNWSSRCANCRWLSDATPTHEADRALKKLLKGLSGDQTVSVIRAFTYFSHLANLAEDRHHIRRRIVHERAGDTQEGSIEVALARLRWAGIAPKTIAQTLAAAYVSPVLTAHPTEVQRKSILDAERDIANLLTERDAIRARAVPKDALAPRELAANEGQMRARVLQLWQTRLLRFSKLTVSDEIENALSYYEATFLREIPKIYADLEREMGQHPVASFLRMGQWIGGDRDGNPNVSAQTLEYALRRQAEVALRHYLTEVHWLGSELSLSAMLVGCTDAMRELAQRSPDTNEHRQDEPYRRALTGVYARLAATLKDLTGGDAARHARGAPECLPYSRGVPGRPGRHPRLAAGPPWRRAGGTTSAPADPRCGSVRFSPGDGRPAPKLGPARGRRGRAAGCRAHRASLCRTGRTRTPRGADPSAQRRAAAARAGSQLLGPGPQGTGHLRGGPRHARALRYPGHPPLHHQPHRDSQ